jgi:RNA polymerase sigma factor (TIGR02999 family)
MIPSKDATSIFEANGRLKPDLYEELRRLATMRMATQPHGQTLQATALVHEAWLRMTANGERLQWNDRRHFFSVAAEAMRNILVDNARKKSRQRHGGDQVRVQSDVLEFIPSPDQNEEILLLNEGITALEKIDPVRAQVVVLKFFGGLKTDETAQSLGISERSVERHWTCAKVWLFQWMQKTRES